MPETTTPRYPGETPDGAFRAEVLARGETRWAANALRFDTAGHANAYASDLSGRWLQVDRWRAVPATRARALRARLGGRRLGMTTIYVFEADGNFIGLVSVGSLRRATKADFERSA